MTTTRLTVALAAVSALYAAGAPAQQTSPDPLTPSAEIASRELRPGLHVLTGGGGNIAVWNGADGILLVDDNLAPLAPQVVAAVARIAEGPVRFVINTHWHPDHTGGNETIGRTGSIIVAQDNVRTRMTEAQFIELTNTHVPAAPPGALPFVTFGDSLTLNLNGDDLEVEHVSNAHTDGDSVLRWRRANVIHTGDVYTSGTFPFIDAGSGGTLAGLVAAVEAVLARADDATIIIPGHGVLSNRRELAAWRDMLVTVGRRVRESVEQGRSVDEVLAARPTAEFDARYGHGFITPESFVRILYRDLAPSAGVRPTSRN